MADLTDLQTAQTVKLVGADSSGVEATPWAVATDGKAHVGDSAGVGSYNRVNVTTTASELKVGGSPLANRRAISVQPEANFIYLGLDNTVSATKYVYKIAKDQTFFLPFGAVSVWLVASTGTIAVAIGEFA